MRFILLALLPSFAFATGTPAPSVPTQLQNQNQQQTQGQAQLQGQGQHQSAVSGSTSTAAATSNTASNIGAISPSNALALNYEDRLQIPFTPAPTSPNIQPTAPCLLGSSDAVTLPVFGKSKGRTAIDPTCQFLELVRVTNSVDPCLARKLLATHPAIAAIDSAPVVCSPDVPRETLVTRDYVDKQVQGAKDEAKQRDDALFRQAHKK